MNTVAAGNVKRFVAGTNHIASDGTDQKVTVEMLNHKGESPPIDAIVVLSGFSISAKAPGAAVGFSIFITLAMRAGAVDAIPFWQGFVKVQPEDSATDQTNVPDYIVSRTFDVGIASSSTPNADTPNQFGVQLNTGAGVDIYVSMNGFWMDKEAGLAPAAGVTA